MKRILYLDASAGVSGDMFVGTLIDLGADLRVIRSHLDGLGLAGVTVRTRRVSRAGLVGTKFDVVDPTTGVDVDQRDASLQPDSSGCHAAHHGHADEHRQGDGHANPHGHRHSDPHGHSHGHGKGHAHPHPASTEDHHHRGLREIRQILETDALPEAVARDALAVFEVLAAAEAKVHGVGVDRVHFHEVGALDAIADIVAAASAFHQLGVDEAWCSPLHVGSGTVRCAHGVLPVPAPATAEILRGIPIYSDGVRGELVTPTGAALVRHFCTRFAPLPRLVLDTVGYGAGSKDFGIPNLLRGLIGTAPDAAVERPVAQCM